jgi:Ca-activated chloride channel homolog
MRYLVLVFLMVLTLVAFRHREEFTVNGKITDASGVGIAGVSVIVKGTTIGTTTDASGNFTLKVYSKKPTLVVSAAGYETKEINVKNDGKQLNITLNVMDRKLQEVLVTRGFAPGAATQRPGERRTKMAKSNFTTPVITSGYFATSEGRKDRVYRNGDTTIFNGDFNTEGYDAIVENRFLATGGNPLSTFSIDVDAAAYSNVRRMINAGNMPNNGAVRIEEMINYFKYDYPQPTGEHPFSINTEIAECPWNAKHKLVLIGLQGKKIPVDNLPPSNLVFLIDVSGSMMSADKLPLVQQSMKLLVDQLREQDKVSIVVYAGAAGTVLPSTSGDEKMKIKDAIDALVAGGSTAGGEGIRLAYKIAKQNFNANGNNRVILCTDGDFNVGVSSNDELERLIEQERKSGVFLTVLGYGTGNYQDNKMQRLANKGNGNHGYIDNINEAKKVLVNEFGGTLFTIAKDVKLQIEFNPAKVQAYRLIGYENRMLAKEDFNNDEKDAGELGSGHTVTALYEVIPVGVESKFIEKVDKLKYSSEPKTLASNTTEIMTIKFRYKKPDEDKSRLIEHAVNDQHIMLSNASANFRFASAVAAFSMVLRNSEFKQSASYNVAWKLAKDALGNDEEGYRSEFLQLLKRAEGLKSVGRVE